MDFLGDSTVPVGDVQGNWNNFDTQDNDIGLNGVTVTASGGYNMLYTGASVDPLKVNWAKRGMHGGGFETEYKTNLSGLNIFTTVTGAADFTLNATRYTTIGTQRLGNWIGGIDYAITDIGKYNLAKFGNLGKVTFQGAGKAIGYIGLIITGLDMRNNGINWSNGTDLVMGAVGFIPVVGWAISGAYFIANPIVMQYSGKTIGQHFGELYGHSMQFIELQNRGRHDFMNYSIIHSLY